MIGFLAVLLFVPETKALSLEELDQGSVNHSVFDMEVLTISTVFSVPTRVHAAYQVKALPRNIKKYIFRMNVPDVPPLYEHERAMQGMSTDAKTSMKTV